MVESRSQREARITAEQAMENDNEFPDIDKEYPGPDRYPPVPNQSRPNNAPVPNNLPIPRNQLVSDLNPKQLFRNE